MELDQTIYDHFKTILWFSSCGIHPPVPPMSFTIQWCDSLSKALLLLRSDNWVDAKTEAQGDLTGYLTKHHYDEYGGHWNRLAKASRKKVQDEVMPIVVRVLERLGAVETLASVLLLDLNRIALHAAYKRRFRKVPDFYEKLLEVYERGYLPCGWDSSLDDWPRGQIIVF